MSPSTDGEGIAQQSSERDRLDMTRKENTYLSLTRQRKFLKISLSSIYYSLIGLDHATIDTG